jgi:hypothetical protein
MTRHFVRVPLGRDRQVPAFRYFGSRVFLRTLREKMRRSENRSWEILPP